jgi:hypothetical protein
MGDWKGVRLYDKKMTAGPIQLYDLKTDIGESDDVAGQHQDIVRKIEDVMNSRTPSEFPRWNF